MSILSVLFTSIYGLVKHGILSFKTNNILWHILRSLAITVTACANAFALRTLQLDEFYSIVFIAPFMLAVMAFLFLKEPLNKKQIYGIVAGFICVIYMVRPGQELFQVASLFVILGTFFYTINCLIMRILKDTCHTFIFPLYTSLSIGIFTLVYIILTPENQIPTEISNKNTLLFLLLGVTSSLGTAFLSIGFQKAPNLAVVAPFHYTQMIWGIITGYLLFGDLPGHVTLIGATGLIITGIYVLNHETKNSTNKSCSIPNKNT